MPVVIELGGGLALVVTLVVALGLLAVWRGIATPALEGLANLLDRISIPIPRHRVHVFGPVSDAARWAVAAGDHALSALVLVTEKGVIALWHGLAYQARLLGRLLGDLAETIERRLVWVLAMFPPAAALWLAVRVAQQVAKLPGRVQSLAHRLYRDIPREIAAAKAAVLAALAVVARRATIAWHAGTVTLPHRIDRIGDGVRWIGRTLRATRAQVARHARLLTAAGSAALVAAALARLGLGWLRCGRVSRLGKRACGINADYLDDLLLGTLAITGSISLVETARDLQSITEPVLDFTRTLIREL